LGITGLSASKATRPRLVIRVSAIWRKKWVRVTAAAVGIPVLLLFIVATYYYVQFARLLDAQLHGEHTRVLPRIFARPFELRVGESLSPQQLVDRLNDLGYAERPVADQAGEFAIQPSEIVIAPRADELKGAQVRVRFPKPPVPPRNSKRPPPKPAARVDRLELNGKPADRLVLDAPMLSSIVAERAKRRPVALAAIPSVVVQAVLAIEDRRYYYHPGIDPIRLTGAFVNYVLGRSNRVSATSTITQQLMRNVFLPQFEGWSFQQSRERLKTRKALEMWASFVLTQRATKDEILEMYLNEVPLGQRGSFAIYGVSEAARLMFGKDVSNLTLPEAATVAGVIQSPSALSPFTNPGKCRERRNVVLQAMADSEFISEEDAQKAAREPLTIVARALEAEAPYFVDYVNQTLAEQYPGLTSSTDQPVNVYTTLDLHLQRLAQDAVRDGLTNVDQLLARRKRKGKAEAALIAIDPRTGDILAMVGGRSYNQSQYNRALVARRQPGSVFKPFVYLTAFEQAAAKGETDTTPASLVNDEPTTWEYDDQVWTPENYEGEYDGIITYRRALAKSRNIATIKVAERAGYDKVAALWKQLAVGTPPKPFPSIALGVFEATPFEVATAYTIFPNLGVERSLQHIVRVESGGVDITRKPETPTRTITRPATTFLVTSMMESVIDEGTGAGARSAGFKLEAAGKTGTTNDLRDAWFVGFTPELLTVVWVGFDDNQPVGLSGAQAALPIWTPFMTRALAGKTSVPFGVPEGITFAEICTASGKLAAPHCPKTISEAFASGTQPTEQCLVHQF
jgi:penicillin-binding protein 1B